MIEADERAVVRDWNARHGWAGDTVDRGHAALFEAVELALERELHRTGAAALLEWNERTDAR